MPLRPGETIPQMVARVAREQGLDARATKIALAIVAQESKFNPNAEGDWSQAKGRMRSIGLFQLNEEGLGAGMGDARYDPEANAIKGISNLKANYTAHSDLSDGAIAYLSQRPADKAGYTNSINAKTSGSDTQWAGTIQSAMQGMAQASPQEARVSDNTKPVFPLAGQSAGNTKITTEFGAHGSNAGYSGVPETHRGTDYSAGRGTPVVAPVSGTVTMAHAWNGTKNDPYGNWIEVKGDDGKNYRFAHLQQMDVQAGSKIGQGQQLGKVDSTGNSTGDHLHVEVMDAQHGNSLINPKDYLATGTSVGSPVGGANMADATAQANAVVAKLEQQASDLRTTAAASKAKAEGLQSEKSRNDAELATINAVKNKSPQQSARKTELTGRNNQILQALPGAQDAAAEDAKTLRAVELQLATAQKQAQGKDLDPSERAQNEAAAESARAQAARLEQEVKDAKDPNSPENQLKLGQAQLYRKQADNYDSIVKADNALKGAQATSAEASANQSNAQADFIRGTLESTVRQHLAAAGLDDAQAKVALGTLQPTIDKIIAETGKTKTDAEYTRALTKAVNEKLPLEIAKMKSEGHLTDVQANDLAAKLPGAITLQGTQARLDQAQAEAQRASGISTLATAHKTQFDMQMEAWKAQRQNELTKLMSQPGVTSDQIGGFLMSAASNATEMVNAFNAQVAKSTAEETARHTRTQEGIDIQNADETMRNNLQNNITNFMNARTNQQEAATHAVGPTLGAARVANTLNALGPINGEEGVRKIASTMGVGSSVMDGVMAGIKDYQSNIQGLKSQMPNVRMANANVATPNFMAPGVAAGAAAGAKAVQNLTPPPTAPNLNLPSSVPADQPAVVNQPAAPAAAGNTPPDQMDNTGPEPQQPTEEQVQEQKDEEGEGGGGGSPLRFVAPTGRKRGSGGGRGGGSPAPNRAERAMGPIRFVAPLGRRAA